MRDKAQLLDGAWAFPGGNGNLNNGYVCCTIVVSNVGSVRSREQRGPQATSRFQLWLMMSKNALVSPAVFFF